MDAPAFWSWLPAPAALEVDRYGLRYLSLDPMRTAGAAERVLNPKRYTLRDLATALPSTTELLTLSNADFGAGLLHGEYDTEALREQLTADGFEAGGSESTLVSDGVVVETGADRLLWADRASGAAETIDALRAQLDDATGDPYPVGDDRLERVLDAIEPADSRFLLSYAPGAASDFLEGARYHANGMTFGQSSVEWRIAVVYEEAPPEGAARRYRELFQEKQGFTDVLTQTDGELLELEVSTSPIHATTTAPL